MYYSWEPEFRVWQDKIINAKMRPFAERWWKIDRWSCAPLELPVSHIEYTIDRRAPLSDMLFSGSDWLPCSSRLRAALRSLGVQFQEIPCRLFDTESGELVSDDYAVVHLLECHYCMDLVQSVYESEVVDSGELLIVGIRRIVPTPQCLEAAYPLFRMREARHMVLAHERTRQLFLKEGITGVMFVPVDKLRD